MFCKDCDKRDTCTATCKEVEKYLQNQGIYSADYIRPEVSSKQRKEERKNGVYLSRYREIPFTDLKRNKDGDSHDYNC